MSAASRKALDVQLSDELVRDAAPEMLAALKIAAAYIHDDIGRSGARMDYSDTNALYAIKAAIAKAEGTQ